MSTALSGRGDKLGDYFEQLDGYLKTLNQNSGDITADLASAAGVTDTYADVAPALTRIAKNATTTSRTLASESAALDAFLADLTKAATRGTEFVDTLRDPLVRALRTNRPGLEALEEYSVAFPCIINGLAKYSDYIALALGGNVPGIQGNTDFGPGQRGYRYPQDLPKLDTTTGPHCYTAPSTRPNDPPRRVFDDGTTSYKDSGDAPTIPTDPITFYETVLGLPFPKGTG
jgi:phospholipid/cholesterol/gamma-HCH transport system substrate-binding protein